MTRSPTRVRRGAHRTGRDLASALLPSLLAVAAVAALVTALYVWRGQDPSHQGAVAADKRSTTAAPQRAAPSTGAPAPSGPASTGAASPSATDTTSTAPVGRLEVVVLNSTGRAGLAHAVAQRLRAKGWTVVKEGNFRGQVPATTVYYPAGAQADAQAAAEALPTSPRVRPRFGNLSATRLTIVVAADYPS